MNKKNKPSLPIIKDESPYTTENRPKKEMVSLGGFATTEAGKLTRSNYFRFIDYNLDDYSDIHLTDTQARKISTHLRKMSTGSTAMVPMSCFVKDVLITMADGTVKPIQDIEVGDYVLTHMGRSKKVVKLFQHLYDGDMYQFYSNSQNKTASGWTTANHEYFARKINFNRKNNNPACGRQFKQDRILNGHIKLYGDKKHTNLLKKQGRHVSIEDNWFNAETITEGMFLSYPLRDSYELTNDLSFEEQKALAIALGFYLAEGSLDVNKLGHREGDGVRYSLHLKEDEYRNLISNAWQTLGYSSRQYKRPKHTVSLVHVAGREPAQLMYKLGGRYSHKKKLGKTVMHWPHYMKLLLLRSFAQGDGTIYSNLDGCEITTTSQNLIWQLYQLSVDVGLNPGLPSVRIGSDKGVKKKYMFYIPKKGTLALFGDNLTPDYSIIGTKCSDRFYDNNQYWRKVVKIERKSVINQKVYNFEVEDDHSYIVNGYAVHNCGGGDCVVAAFCPLVQMRNSENPDERGHPYHGKAPLLKQCHPPGEKILTTKHGYVSIEDLDPNIHKLVSWERKYNMIRQGNFKIAKSYRKDPSFTTFTTQSGKSYSCTSDHICVTRFNENAIGKFIVYLMQKGNAWRIGKSKCDRNYLSFPMRGYKEKADAMWILGVYETNTQALLMEDYYSIYFQVSKVCFTYSQDQKTVKWNGMYKWVSQEELDSYHQFCSNNITRNINTKLEQMGLSIKYPIWTKEQRTEQDPGYKLTWSMRACNVLPEVMDFLVYQEGQDRPIKEEIIKINKKPYEGIVYSLEVTPYETYIVNDIITHNCLIETQLLKEWTMRYFDEYEIDPDNFTEVGYINELAELQLLEMRINMNLAKPENASLMIDQTMSISNDGTPVIQKHIHPLLEQKEKISSRRQKIVKLMVGDRQEKYKKEAALKVREDKDPSTKMAETSAKLNKLMNEMNKATSIDNIKASNKEGHISPNDIINADDDDKI